MNAFVLYNKNETEAFVIGIKLYKLLGLHQSAMEMFLWGIHCGAGGIHVDATAFYDAMLGLGSDVVSTKNEDLFWSAITSSLDATQLPILLSVLVGKGPKSYPRVFQFIETHLGGALASTNSILSKQGLSPWMPKPKNESLNYDLTSLEYQCLRSAWLNVMTELLSQSKHGGGQHYVDTKIYLRKIFTQSTVDLAVWLDQVITEVNQNLCAKAKDTLLKNLHKYNLPAFGLINPYNIGMWIGMKLNNYDLIMTILRKIPSSIEYNVHTYTILTFVMSRVTVNTAHRPTVLQIATTLAESILAGTASAGHLHPGLSQQQLQDRITANLQCKVLLSIASKEYIRNVKELSSDSPRLHTELSAMKTVMLASIKCGYTVDSKEIEVCILNLANNCDTQGRWCLEDAVTLTHYFMRNAMAIQFKAVLLLLTKLCDRYDCHDLLASLWCSFPYPIYLRILRETHVYPILKALLANGHYAEGMDYFNLITSTRNFISLFCISDPLNWENFLTCCQQYRSIDADRTHQSILQAIDSLYISRKSIDLSLMIAISRTLKRLNMLEYYVILVETQLKGYSSYERMCLVNANGFNDFKRLLYEMELAITTSTEVSEEVKVRFAVLKDTFQHYIRESVQEKQSRTEASQE